MYLRFAAALSLAAALAVACIAHASGAQDPAEEGGTRGAFFKTRPDTAPAKTGRKSQPPKRSSKGSASTPAISSVAPPIDRAIGLGYTIFMRDAKGVPIRVDPKQVFRSGDHVRLMVEPNVDGYLYIFTTEDGGKPSMLYPDPRLNEGDNRVAAHTPVEIPSRKEKDPEAQWFVFDANPATERLYFVVTRAPLPSVPTGQGLLDHYKAYPDSGYFSPPDAVWSAVTRGQSVEVDESLIAASGQRETAEEADALTRSIGLSKKAAQPAVVRINAVAGADMHVTVVDLVHK
jgi:hypothetical protein